jgi:hypothetical protein
VVVTLVTRSGNYSLPKTRDPDDAMGAGFKSTELAKCRDWRRFRALDQLQTDWRASRRVRFCALASRLHRVCMKVPRIAL